MTLYNCKVEIDRDDVAAYRITKFDADLNVESSYLTTPVLCQCPGFERRQRCRHTEMLPKFIREGATSGKQFYDYERKRFSEMELTSLLRFGAEIIDPSDPREAHNAIARAIGEPEIKLTSQPQPEPDPRPKSLTLRRL